MVKESSSFGVLHKCYFYCFLFAILFFGSFLAPFQEDAFITFRTAQNLAFHREFSYNLGMHYPSATSPLFGYFVAFLYIIAPLAVEMVLRILSCLAVAVGVILIPIIFRVPHNLRQTTILTTALLPVMLQEMVWRLPLSSFRL